MSNYRRGYDRDLELTSRQRRRWRRKSWRDARVAQTQGLVSDRNPSRPKGLSGHPGRRRVQLAERAR